MHRRRVLDLTEAEEVVSACMTSVLHLLLIDPSPPTVLRALSRHLARYGSEAGAGAVQVEPMADEDRARAPALREANFGGAFLLF